MLFNCREVKAVPYISYLSPPYICLATPQSSLTSPATSLVLFAPPLPSTATFRTCGLLPHSARKPSADWTHQHNYYPHLRTNKLALGITVSESCVGQKLRVTEFIYPGNERKKRRHKPPSVV